MNEKPVCSIVIPAYRCEAFIAECIESAQKQTIRSLEILVIDDGSPDNAGLIVENMAENDRRIRYIRQEKNLGVAEARNRGVAEAHSDWIAFLDSDDIWLPEKLEKQLALQGESAADLIYTGAQCIDDQSALLNRIFRVPPKVTFKTLLRQNDIICSSVLIRREVFLRFQMERSDLHEDYICWQRILMAGYTAAGIPDPLVLYRLTAGSKSRQKLQSAAIMWKTYRHLEVPFLRRCFSFIAYSVHGARRYWL